MQRAWLAFARCGCPDTDGSWRSHSPGHREPARVGADDRGAVEVFERVRGFWAERGFGSLA
jgi:hypothetical protein